MFFIGPFFICKDVMLPLIYTMFENLHLSIKKLYKYIISCLILFNLLLADDHCPLTFTESFFNDDIIGYYLSAIDINTGESNVLLFDYTLGFGSDCDLPDDIDITFKIDVDIPSYTSGQVTLASGDFKLTPNPDSPHIRSFSFRNTDMSLDQTYLPGGATLQGGDYEFDPVEGLSSAITSAGRLPNGQYSFRFSIEDCPNNLGFTCDSGINKVLNLFIPSYLNLVSPGSSSIGDTLSNQVFIPNPVFQWNSDYCSSCSNYFIRISEFNPNIHITLEDAMNDASILPIGSGFFDTGFSNGNIFQYPATGFQNLNPGSIYVWKIKRSYLTTNGEMEDESTSFVFKMKSDEPEQSFQTQSLAIDEEKLIKIKNLIGESKFNEFFNQDNGSLYNFNPSSSTIFLNNEEKPFEYLNELIELLNSSSIEIIEVEIE